MVNHVHAAIQLGPVITDTNAAEQRRGEMYYQAQLSFQEKLKVGQQRYQKKLDRRAAVLAGMESQLQIQEQTIQISPPTIKSGEGGSRSIGLGVQLIIAGLILVSIFGFEHFSKRRKIKTR